jgi:cytochrome c oxidase subunit 3
LISVLALWWRDVIREATFEGAHTGIVQKNHKFVFVLFIVSDIMFFFAFFWAFFHSSLSPVIEIGCVWPPAGIEPFNPWKVPLLNTIILLTSGLTITVCHYALLLGKVEYCLGSFARTIFLAILFTLVQLYEYRSATFSISDGIYGSTFFMATGFHGFHVLIGTIFITVCFIRFLGGHFTRTHHVGFECAAWYWHFVDVVWLFLFVVVYWWGGA